MAILKPFKSIEKYLWTFKRTLAEVTFCDIDCQKSDVESGHTDWGEWSSGLMGSNRIGRLPCLYPSRCLVGLRTHLVTRLPVALGSKIDEIQWLALGGWGCPLGNGLKVTVYQLAG